MAVDYCTKFCENWAEIGAAMNDLYYIWEKPMKPHDVTTMTCWIFSHYHESQFKDVEFCWASSVAKLLKCQHF